MIYLFCRQAGTENWLRGENSSNDSFTAMRRLFFGDK